MKCNIRLINAYKIAEEILSDVLHTIIYLCVSSMLYGSESYVCFVPTVASVIVICDPVLPSIKAVLTIVICIVTEDHDLVSVSRSLSDKPDNNL